MEELIMIEKPECKLYVDENSKARKMFKELGFNFYCEDEWDIVYVIESEYLNIKGSIEFRKKHTPAKIFVNKINCITPQLLEAINQQMAELRGLENEENPKR